MKELWDRASELESKGEPFAIITMLADRGHTPQDPGAKAIVTERGLEVGTVGGGKVEAKAIEWAKQRLENAAEPLIETVVWNLQTDVGMTCGGEVTFLFEIRRPRAWKIAVFGAGHVGQKLVPLLAEFDAEVVCVDPRPEWLSRLEGSTRAQLVQTDEPDVWSLRCDETTSFVVMTKGHSTDLPVLLEIYRRFPRAPYVGVIGSRVKGIRLKKTLADEGVDSAWLDRLHCPMGLPLGSNQPAEISVSIAAQLLQVRDQKD